MVVSSSKKHPFRFCFRICIFKLLFVLLIARSVIQGISGGFKTAYFFYDTLYVFLSVCNGGLWYRSRNDRRRGISVRKWIQGTTKKF